MKEEWDFVETLLPVHWQWQARRTGALRRLRGASSITNVLRLLMLHISGGLSIEQTCVRARELGIADVTAMALFKRLRLSQGWLLWMCEQLIKQRGARGFDTAPLKNRRVLAVDASDIREPAARASSWRLHYALSLPTLRCEHAHFSSPEVAESLCNFPIEAGDVVMADRAYGTRSQLGWLKQQGADAIVRVSPNHFLAQENAGEETPSDLPFDWLKHLRTLKGYKPGEWKVRFTHEGKSYTARVCAVRKSVAAQQKAIKAIEAEARKKKRAVRAQTLEYAKYVIVVCTLSEKELGTREALETYRSRWQVELAFKRLKSLLEAGSVPKTLESSALAWMQGKLLEALLVEKLLEEAEVFSPWGHGM